MRAKRARAVLSSGSSLHRPRARCRRRLPRCGRWRSSTITCARATRRSASCALSSTRPATGCCRTPSRQAEAERQTRAARQAEATGPPLPDAPTPAPLPPLPTPRRRSARDACRGSARYSRANTSLTGILCDRGRAILTLPSQEKNSRDDRDVSRLESQKIKAPNQTTKINE